MSLRRTTNRHCIEGYRPTRDDDAIVWWRRSIGFGDVAMPFDSQLAGLRPADYSLRTFDMIDGLAMSEPFGSPEASWKASRMVRKGGFEPPRSCERQPLKLVRLPVPPLPQGA
jgi:hypothetical protein